MVGAEGLEPSCGCFTGTATNPWSAPETQKSHRGFPGWLARNMRMLLLGCYPLAGRITAEIAAIELLGGRREYVARKCPEISTDHGLGKAQAQTAEAMAPARNQFALLLDGHW